MNPIRDLFGENAGILRRLDYQLLLLATIPTPLGVGLVSPILSALTGPFGVSAARIGLVMTFFFAPSIVVTPVAGSLADRYGRKPLLVGGLLLFGVGGAAIAATTAFELLLVFRLLQGVGFGTVVPVTITSLGDLYEGDEEATAQGIRTAVFAVAGAVGPAVAGVLVALAWQYPLLLYGLAVPIAVVLYIFFEEPAETLAAGEDRSQVRELAGLATHPWNASIILAFAVPSFLFISFLTYNSFIVVEGMGGTARDAGILVAVTYVVVSVSASQAGRVTAAFDTRFYPLVAANVVTGAGLVLVALTPSVVLGAVGSASIGLGAGLLIPLYRSILTDSAPEPLRGGLVSVGESVRSLGATTAPLALGLCIELVQPTLSSVAAVRWVTGATGVLGAGAGIGLLLIARTVPHVREDGN